MSKVKQAEPLASHERNELSSVNAGPIHNPPLLKPAQPGAVRGTAENDAAVASAYPQLGDSVRVDVDRVPFMEQNAVHQRLRASSVHGRIGTVVGSEVIGSVYHLIVDTGSGRMPVPADCLALEAPPLPDTKEMQEPRTSPEKMHKHSSGSYNLT